MNALHRILGHLGDELHFSADVSRELGRRLALAMRRLRGAQATR